MWACSRSLKRAILPKAVYARPASLALRDTLRGSRRLTTNNNEDGDSSELKLIYPESPAKEHSDLASFLAYAKRTDLKKRTSVYRGTHYEYMVAQALAKYGFYLRRVGGASDRGMDLLGTWTMPSTTPAQTLRVVLQCKAGAEGPGPANVRELHGALQAAPPGWRGAGVVGLLVGEVSATKGIRDELATGTALGYIRCSRNGEVMQLLWNMAAQEAGLEGITVGVQHGGAGDGVIAGGEEGGSADDVVAAGTKQKLVLMKDGRPLPLLERSKSTPKTTTTTTTTTPTTTATTTTPATPTTSDEEIHAKPSQDIPEEGEAVAEKTEAAGQDAPAPEEAKK